MSIKLKRWAKLSLAAGASAVGGIYYAYAKYKVRHDKTIAREPPEPLEVTYNHLPQYGPNFKVGQCAGFTLPDFVNINAVRSFESRASDVWVISYPKSGTTWVQELVYLLVRRRNNHYHLLAAVKTALATNLDDRVPFIEFPCPGLDAINKLSSPRIIKSHLPLQLLPPSVLETPTVKIIYVTRNPRDVAVSLYHFMNILTEVQMAENFGFDDFVDDFLSGSLPYSPYLPHVASYVKSLETEGLEKKFLIVRYEDLKTHLRREVNRIAKFLNYDLLDDEDWKWMKHYTKFDVMKNQKSSNYSWFKDLGIIKKEGKFLRKGLVGDWMSHLSDKQVERFHEQIEIPLLELTGHENPVNPPDA